MRGLKRKRLTRCAEVAPRLWCADQEWALDFACDTLASGRGIRVLAVVDAFTRECLTLEVDTSLSSQRVTRSLEQAIELHRLPIGFEPSGLVHIVLAADRDNRRPASLEMYRQMTERLKALPSVSDVGICQFVPLVGDIGITNVTVPARAINRFGKIPSDPDISAPCGLPCEKDASFVGLTAGLGANVAIVNASAAKALFRAEDALGRQVSDDRGKTWREIVGVVEDAKYSSVRAESPPTIYYRATRYMEEGSSLVFMLRVSGPVAPVISAAGELIHKSVPELPAPVAISMEDTMNESLASERMLAMLAGLFGTLALAETGIGLYGTLAYMTERRTGEIGIRMALGARRSDIAFLVSVENGVLALSGCLVGLAVSLMASKQVASFLFGITPHDPLAFGVAVIAILLVAVTASVSPAVKATRVDPLSAIRYE